MKRHPLTSILKILFFYLFLYHLEKTDIVIFILCLFFFFHFHTNLNRGKFSLRVSYVHESTISTSPFCTHIRNICKHTWTENFVEFDQLRGPTWDVKLGRRDSRTASQSAANNGIPRPTSNLNQLISRFNALGLSTKDLVALSGIIKESNNIFSNTFILTHYEGYKELSNQRNLFN